METYRTYASFASQIQLEANVVLPSSWLLLPAASVVPPPSSTSSSPGTGAGKIRSNPNQRTQAKSTLCFLHRLSHGEFVNICELLIPSKLFDKQVPC